MKLRLQGNSNDKVLFVASLERLSGLDLGFCGDEVTDNGPRLPGFTIGTRAVKAVLDEGEMLVMTLVRGDRGVDFDSYANRSVDLTDLEALPELVPWHWGRPSTPTRRQTLVHILVEYAHALQRGYVSGEDGFQAAHAAGLYGENLYRSGQGQPGSRLNKSLSQENVAIDEYSNGAFIFLQRSGGSFQSLEKFHVIEP
jgi:hypothetical protein